MGAHTHTHFLSDPKTVDLEKEGEEEKEEDGINLKKEPFFVTASDNEQKLPVA